jgi:hypothetical protein
MQNKKLKQLAYVLVGAFIVYQVFLHAFYSLLLNEQKRPLGSDEETTSVNSKVVIEEKKSELLVSAEANKTVTVVECEDKNDTTQSASQNNYTTEDNYNPVSKENANNYLLKYPFMLDCLQDYNKIATDDIKYVDEKKAFLKNKHNYLAPAANETHDLRILRAVLVYFPVDGLDHYQQELRWLYRSWIHMQSYEPKLWRTDLIIFYDVEASEHINNPEFFLNKLNCTVKNRRFNQNQPPMCTILPYIAVKDRTESNINTQNPLLQSRKIYERLFNDVNIYNTSVEDIDLLFSLLKLYLDSYDYLDSIVIAFEVYPYAKSAEYDVLIRSDMDVFLTPALASWLPRYCNDFVVGGGAYSNDFNRKRLHRIANSMGLKHGWWSNLGI